MGTGDPSKSVWTSAIAKARFAFWASAAESGWIDGAFGSGVVNFSPQGAGSPGGAPGGSVPPAAASSCAISISKPAVVPALGTSA